MIPSKRKFTLPAAALLLLTFGSARAEQTSDAEDASFAPESAAAGSVEVSVGDLQELLNLPAGASFKESAEDPRHPKTLFGNQTQIERFVHGLPTFVYFAERPDPMIVPFVRERVVAEELLGDARMAREAKDFDKAELLLRRIRDQYPNTDSAPKAVDELASIAAETAPKPIPAPQKNGSGPIVWPVIADLPIDLSRAVSAVMINTEGKSVAVVGNHFLHAGDPVPEYPAVRVKSIAPSEVVLVYMNKEFPIQVAGTL